MDEGEHLKRLLKAIRNYGHLSHDEAAGVIGRNVATYRRLESLSSGAYYCPDVEELLALATAVDWPGGELSPAKMNVLEDQGRLIVSLMAAVAEGSSSAFLASPNP